MGDPPSLQEDTVPLSAPGLKLHKQLFQAVSSMLCHCWLWDFCVVRTLYSGMLSKAQRELALSFGLISDPQTLRIEPFGLQNPQSSCGKVGSCPHPSPI